MPYLMLLDENSLPRQEWEIGDKPLTVGRGEDADVQIADARLSRRHFQIKMAGDTHILEDLDSSTGTTLNDAPASSSPLKPGDLIQAGSSRFYYDVGLDTFVKTQVDAKPTGEGS